MKIFRRGMVLLAVVLTLAFVGRNVWSNERVIAEGRDVFIPLRPVDPLSLVQGYYMELNMELQLGKETRSRLERDGARYTAQPVVFSVGPQGHGTLLRVRTKGETLADDEVVLPVVLRGGTRAVILPDSFMFQEGQAEVFEQARFGHFRALTDGRAVLIGLADASREPLGVLPRRVSKAP